MVVNSANDESLRFRNIQQQIYPVARQHDSDLPIGKTNLPRSIGLSSFSVKLANICRVALDILGTIFYSRGRYHYIRRFIVISHHLRVKFPEAPAPTQKRFTYRNF